MCASRFEGDRRRGLDPDAFWQVHRRLQACCSPTCDEPACGQFPAGARPGGFQRDELGPHHAAPEAAPRDAARGAQPGLLATWRFKPMWWSSTRPAAAGRGTSPSITRRRRKACRGGNGAAHGHGQHAQQPVARLRPGRSRRRSPGGWPCSGPARARWPAAAAAGTGLRVRPRVHRFELLAKAQLHRAFEQSMPPNSPVGPGRHGHRRVEVPHPVRAIAAQATNLRRSATDATGTRSAAGVDEQALRHGEPWPSSPTRARP